MDKTFYVDYIGNDKVDFNMDDCGTLKEEGLMIISWCEWFMKIFFVATNDVT